ncbi:glycoside hydrolase family 108 protein [Sphingobium cupriresistens]|uniref:Secretion activating protein n=1 Tax=Sphingobium cupriresistens LL01 TaxID=1420583 RepID=A0A0J7XZN7_9SPHN|nr:glycosyl hydrolase 108 family protein [Sphingobium cupriresistens]KMS57141.1 secretion activating protein [Sphingobium cupriresistens LL01]
MTIDQMIDEAIGREGGYVNNPKDKGGPTRWGITEQVARAYGYKGAMNVLPRETAVAIYRQRYAIDPGFDKIAAICPAIGHELFDTGINMGVATAGRFLQRALNVLNRQQKDYPDLIVDGACGEKTRAALKGYVAVRGAAGGEVLRKALDALQGARYIEIAEANPTQEAFLYGWIANRVGVLA